MVWRVFKVFAYCNAERNNVRTHYACASELHPKNPGSEFETQHGCLTRKLDGHVQKLVSPPLGLARLGKDYLLACGMQAHSSHALSSVGSSACAEYDDGCTSAKGDCTTAPSRRSLFLDVLASATRKRSQGARSQELMHNMVPAASRCCRIALQR